MNNLILIFLLAIPLAGAVIGTFVPNKLARTWALLVSLVTLAVGAYIASQFDLYAGGVQLQFRPMAGSPLYMEALGTSFSLGITSIGLWLVLLTVLLMPLAIAASFGSIKDREKEYYAWMLALMTAMLGVFVSQDLLLFYVFFELTLIPMFFIIGIWGGPERRRAAVKFFLFTFAGGVFTLTAAIYLGLRVGNFDLSTAISFAQHNMSLQERWWLLLGFLAGFAVKVPLFPVHTWLPLAHTEAPTAGSVILAGVLLKLGTFGLMIVAVPIGLVGIEPNAVIYKGYLFHRIALGHYLITTGGMIGFLGGLCIIGVIYGALVAWVQQDIKKLVAYSSVSHLGFCVLGLLALNDIGLQGSVLYMINHGLSTGAMFLVIGMIYDRYHTRDINQLSGLAKIMPKLAFFFVFFVMSSIGLPGLNGFWSEFLTILGAFTSDRLGIGFGVLAATGVVLGAIYMLHMTARVIFGPLKVPGHHGDADTSAPGHEAHGHDPHVSSAEDIGGREVAILVPLAIVVIILGVAPAGMMKSILKPVQQIQTPIVNVAGVQSGEKVAVAEVTKSETRNPNK
jgi:NADH-quinone oxidoreductase subunit M